MVTLLYFIIILGVIILIHEFGHFIFAKLFKVHTYEFSIGMGPKIFDYKPKTSETTYTLRLIPIGGYVSMAGEEDDDEEVPSDRKLFNKTGLQRLIIMVAGATFNFISAMIVLLFIALIWGAQNTKPIIAEVSEDMPAFEQGLLVGDQILKIDDKKIRTLDDAMLYIQLESKGNPMEILILRDKKEITIEVAPKKTMIEDQEVFQVGVRFDDSFSRKPIDVLNYTFIKTDSIFRQMFFTISGIFSGKISVKQLSGPVGIYNIVGSQKAGGIRNLLYLIALLSINVGFINLLPIPALDGSKIIFIGIEKIRGKAVDQEVEALIHTVGFILLMTLMLYVTFNDILRLF